MTKKAIEQFLKDKGNLPYVISTKSESDYDQIGGY